MGQRRVPAGNAPEGQRKRPLTTNVIQIRMTERDLELKQVPVSFFVKKYEGKGLTRQGKCAAAFAMN